MCLFLLGTGSRALSGHATNGAEVLSAYVAYSFGAGGAVFLALLITAACLVTAFVSDVLDGIIARRLKVATPALRRFDSLADSLFYLAAVFCAWHLYPEVIRAHQLALGALFGLEIARLLFDIAKFGREASYHMWSSKLWGISLFLAFLSLLACGQSGLAISFAIYLGIAADIEGLAISIVLRRWRTDVPSLVHAWRERQQVQ